MTTQGSAHRSIAWSKQKLDELDATITELDGLAKNLQGDARGKADKAVDRIRSARDAFKTEVDAAGKAVKGSVADVQHNLDDDWVEAELAFQGFLAAAAGDASLAKSAILARAEAQRKSWLAGLDRIRDSATSAATAARSEMDAAVQRLAGEAGKVSTAGDESWKAIRGGLAEVGAVNERTFKKIVDALAGLR